MSMRNGVTPKLKLTLTLTVDPNRYRRRCPDPNARRVCHGSSPPGLLRIFGTHAEQYAQ